MAGCVQAHRLPEPEIEMLGQAAACLSQADPPGKGLPAHDQAGRVRASHRGDVPDIEGCSPAFLSMDSQSPDHGGGFRSI